MARLKRESATQNSKPLNGIRALLPIARIRIWIVALALVAASTLVDIPSLPLRLAYNTGLLLVFLGALLWSERALVRRVVDKFFKR